MSHMSQCPVCGETRIDHVREYVIKGRRVRMAFSTCLHTPEELAAARHTKAVSSLPPERN